MIYDEDMIMIFQHEKGQDTTTSYWEKVNSALVQVNVPISTLNMGMVGDKLVWL